MTNAFGAIGQTPANAWLYVSVPPGQALAGETIEDVTYYGAPGFGTTLLTRDGKVFAVQFRRQAEETIGRASPIPAGLRFGMSRNEVLSLLGSPNEHGDRRVLPALGKMPEWDAYWFAANRIHIEYDLKATSVRMITLSALPPS